MVKTNTHLLTLKNILWGFLVGLVFIFSFLGIELIKNHLPFDLESIDKIISENIYFWFFFTLLFIFPLLIYLVINSLTIKVKSVENQLEREILTSKEILEFVNKLNSEQTEAELHLTDQKDELGTAISALRDTIKKNREEEKKRREEDSQRNWDAEGQAKFGEILREDNDNIKQLSYNVISNLVKYVNANQGGIFLINDDNESDVFIEQIACYAYDRKKFANKKLEWGEGIIGTCILEQHTINLKKVPDGYLYVTSGLGKAEPQNLLIVPLKVNEGIHGAIELASFNEFGEHVISFVEKVAEIIASTISNVKNNLKTSKLLTESREQSEALKSQEEEIRQNLEELQATQEEAKRQSEEFISFTNSVNHTLIRAEYAVDGTLLYSNIKFLNKLGYTKNSEVEGQHISMFINVKDRDWFNDIWKNLAHGGKHFEGYMKHVTKEGQDLWTMSTYTCVRNEDQSVKKILFLAIDTTEYKKQSLDFKGQIDALNRATIKAEFFTSGSVLDCNRKFRELFKYSLIDIFEKTIFDLTHRDEKSSFDESWGKIIKGKPIEGIFKMLSQDKEIIYLRGSFSPVYDMYNDISKIIYIGNDVTYEKQMEIRSKEQSDKLKEQDEKLRQSEEVLREKLRETREAIRQQYKEIEKVKIRNEKTLEGALDAIITTNQQGTVEFFNQAAVELFGIQKQEIIGKNISRLFSDEQIKNDKFIAQYVAPGKKKNIGDRKEITITNSEGKNLTVLILLTEANVESEFTYTAFIQNISVDLF